MPKSIRNVLSSAEICDAIAEVVIDKYGLGWEKYALASRVVGRVLVGIVPYESFKDVLVQYADLSEQVAEDTIEKLENGVLSEIVSPLYEMHGLEIPEEEKIKVALRDLPDEIQNFIVSEETFEKIKELCQKYRLTDEESALFEDLVGKTLMGIIPEDRLIETLEKTLQVSEKTAKFMREDFNDKIFSKLQKMARDSFEKEKGAKKESSPEERLVPMSHVPQKRQFKNVAEEIMENDFADGAV